MVKDAKTFMIVLALHTLLSGCYFTVSASLPQRLFPRELFAQFNSAFGMILALGNTLFGMLFGYILDYSGKNYRLVFVFAIVITCLALWRISQYTIAVAVIATAGNAKQPVLR